LSIFFIYSDDLFSYFSGIYGILLDEQFVILKQIIEDIPFLLTSLRDVRDETLLMSVAWISNVPPFQNILQFDQDLTVADRDGDNIAYYIAKNNDHCMEMYDLLKEKTSQEQFVRIINNVNKNGYSALHYAASKDNHNAINYLIKNNVNANMRDNDGLLPEEHGTEEVEQLIRQYREK